MMGRSPGWRYRAARRGDDVPGVGLEHDGVSGVMPFVQQLYAFGMTMVAGMAVGLMFDGYRYVRRGIRMRGSVSWLLDILFWLVATPLVFALLLVANWGELRFYVLVGLAAGGSFYFGLLSPFVLQSIDGVLWTAGRVLMAAAYGLAALMMIPVRTAYALAGVWTAMRHARWRPPAPPFSRGWRARPWPPANFSWSGSFGRRV